MAHGYMHEIQVSRYKNRHFTKKINIGNLQLTKIPATILFLKDVRFKSN